MQNEHSLVYNKSKIKHCCICISPRIELVIWASISMSCTAFLLIFMFVGIMLIGSLSGPSSFSVFEDIKMLIFSSALLLDIVYNTLVIMASLGKNAKLLKIFLYLAAATCIILCAVTTIAYIPSAYLFHELRFVVTVFVLITLIVRGYMLLIMHGVMLDLQDRDRNLGYIGLDKTMETATDHEPPI